MCSHGSDAFGAHPNDVFLCWWVGGWCSRLVCGSLFIHAFVDVCMCNASVDFSIMQAQRCHRWAHIRQIREHTLANWKVISAPQCASTLHRMCVLELSPRDMLHWFAATRTWFSVDGCTEHKHQHLRYISLARIVPESNIIYNSRRCSCPQTFPLPYTSINISATRVALTCCKSSLLWWWPHTRHYPSGPAAPAKRLVPHHFWR